MKKKGYIKIKIIFYSKIIFKLLFFIQKKIVSFFSGLIDQTIIFYLLTLIIFYLLQVNYFNIGYYNNSCSPLLDKQSIFCSFLPSNVFLFIPEIILFGFLFLAILSVPEVRKMNGKEFYLVPLAYILIFYLILRFVTIQYLNFPLLAWMNKNYYLVGEYFIILVFILFFILVSYKSGDMDYIKSIFKSDKNYSPIIDNKEEEFEKIEKENDFQTQVINDINNNLPDILNKILSGNNFKKNTFEEGLLKPNLLTIESVTFEDETHVFAELDVHTDLIDSISDLHKNDWTLGIHFHGKIKNFVSAKWRSKNGRNGLIIRIKKHTIDMSKIYEYPYFLEENPLLKHPLDIMIGKTDKGEDKVVNLGAMPHLMVAGATGNGKSVAISNVITTLQKNIIKFGKSALHITIIDPKVVDFEIYKGLPGIRVINTDEKALNVLNYYVAEMERRYNLIAGLKKGIKKIDEYNAISRNKLSHEVIIIDEIADLMMRSKGLKKEFETKIARLGQKARAAGIHLVLGTQRPDAQIITGIIKSNIPSVLGFGVINSLNSRIIMDDDYLVNIKNKGECILKIQSQKTLFKTYFLQNSDLLKFIDYYKAEMLKKSITSPLSSSKSLEEESTEDNLNPYVIMEEFPNYLLEKKININKLDSVYQLLCNLVYNNGYKNRDTLRSAGMSFGFTTRFMDQLSVSLKNNGFILFNEKQKTNNLNIELNNEKLLELYNFIKNQK